MTVVVFGPPDHMPQSHRNINDALEGYIIEASGSLCTVQHKVFQNPFPNTLLRSIKYITLPNEQVCVYICLEFQTISHSVTFDCSLSCMPFQPLSVWV